MRLWALPSLSILTLSILAGCGSDNNDTTPAPTPTPVEQTPKSISLSKIGSYQTGVFLGSAAEIPAFDAVSKRGFVVNAQKGVVDVLDLSNPAMPKYIGELDAKKLLAGAEINSVAVHNGVVAVAVQAKVKTDLGFAAFYKASDLSLISQVAVGALPDMITFSPDGKTALVANEAEPSDDYQTDPEGSISVISLADISKPVARTADFKAWNGKEAELRDKGVRIYGPKATAAQDLEPEYITVSADGKTAWATLQENNAFAKIDIASATVTDIIALGYKDHGLASNRLDVSDAELGEDKGKINIQQWAGVRGLYLPDAMSNYQVDGKTYLVTANEGDARAWGEDNDAYWAGDASKGFVEEFRVKHLVHKDGFDRRQGDDLPPQLRALAKGAELNPLVFGYCDAQAGNAGKCRADENLGRLKITWTQGYQTNANGTPKLNERGNLVYDALYSYGGRSFSIWDEQGKLVWDSGDAIEQKIAELLPANFNSDHEEITFDSRSTGKGPEPEGVALGKIGQKTFAFIGLERVGGVMVYDISNPKEPIFVQYVNSRDFKATEDQIKNGQAGDLGPEGLVFVSAQQSPNGKPLLIVGNEVSGSTAIYALDLKY
jgi:hypothetical protein